MKGVHDLYDANDDFGMPQSSDRKYKKGDIVGVCSDAMYEFEIVKWYPSKKVYEAKCVSSYTETVKIGEIRGVPPAQITVKLGEGGKKWPPPSVKKKGKAKGKRLTKENK